MRCANKAITVTRYPTPIIDDLLVKLKDCKHFTKLDPQQRTHRLELEKSCRHIRAFRTENKIMQYTRLIFGANGAAEELQHALQLTLRNIPGTDNSGDDILIYAKNTTDHGQILQQVFKRLSEKGLRTLRNINRPNDIKSLRSFLGMINYLKRFIPTYSTLTFPLRRLTQKYVKFEWNEQCEKAFTQLISSLSEESCLSYLNESKETIVYCDARPVGISALILQRSDDKHNTNAIAYSS